MPESVCDPDRKIPFMLAPHQVPAPPVSNYWVDHIRWCIAVMDSGDRSLDFIASCLSHAIRYDGLTDKQARAVQRVVDRLVLAHHDGRLECQAE